METAVSVCCLAMSNSTETHSQYMHSAHVQHTYQSLLFEESTDLFYFKCMGNFLIISRAFVSHKPNSRNARNPFSPIVRRIIYIYQLSSEGGCRLNPRVHSFDMADDISTTPHQLSNPCHNLMPCSRKKNGLPSPTTIQGCNMSQSHPLFAANQSRFKTMFE